MTGYLHGLHDGHYAEALALMGDRPGWLVFTHELGRDPNHTAGFDHRPWSERGFGIIARLNHGYGSAGTIPTKEHYGDFARRVRSFVKASPGCKVWVIGNEPNHEQERPQGQPITPNWYGVCFTQCAKAILEAQPEAIVCPAAVAPWNATTTYVGNPSGDWIQYFRDALAACRPYVGGIALHTYTHGSDPELVFSDTQMNPPYQFRYYHFRAYRDFMNAIPADLRHLPVYITETDQDQPWEDANRGWIQAAYREIDDWNQAPGRQQIRALVLYRWPRLDRWYIEGKTGVHEDFQEAVARGYTWQEQPVPAQPPHALCIVDLTDTLPHGPEPYGTRSLARVTHLVIHHSATRPDVTAAQMATYHVNTNGWPGIGYHFVVRSDGLVEQTNYLTSTSYHAAGANSYSLGICLVGDFTSTVPPAEQLTAAAALIRWLAANLGIPAAHVVGHKEICSGTVCPGDTWSTWKPIL